MQSTITLKRDANGICFQQTFLQVQQFTATTENGNVSSNSPYENGYQYLRLKLTDGSWYLLKMLLNVELKVCLAI